MLPFSIFKKRKQQAEQAGKPVVYKYDPLPRELRIQIIHIFAEIIDPHWRDGSPLWEYIRTAMAKEIGAFNLAGEHEPFQDCQLYTQTERDTDLVLSLIEVVLYSAISHEGQYVNHDALDSAITELNQRFREHQVGYQYQVGGSQAGQIVRMDSDYLHSEAVEPAVSLLAERGFEGASEEFLKAYKHYREGNHREAMVQALNAFESTMKVICGKRRVRYEQNATASTLINALIKDGLIPPALESEFTSLKNVLSDGAPTLRNKVGGHGQGEKVVEVPGYLASYMLHMTASGIVFLVEAHRAGRK